MNYKSILSGALVATTLLSAGISAVPAQAKELGSYPKIEVPTDKSKAPKKYAMIAKFTKQSKLEFLSAKSKLKEHTSVSGKKELAFIGLDKSDCGKDIARYTNVGMWEGKAVDVIYHLDSVTKAGFKGGEWIRFNSGSIGLTQGGYKEVKVTQRFVYHDTQKDAPVTGSYMTFNDIDAHQALGFSDATMKKVAKIYIAESAKKWIDVTEKNGMTYFGSPSEEDIDPNDPKGKMTMLFDGNAITYSFVKDWSGYNMNKELNWKNSEYDQYYGYRGEKPVRTETLAPTKLVSDKNEKDKKENTLDSVSEEYTYTIAHSVPAEEKQFYSKSYVVADILIPELELIKGSLKVTNSDGKDVTSLFEMQNEGNHVKIVAKKDTLAKPEFYGKDYKFNFNVKVKAGADLSKLKDKDGKITIPNTATVTKDGDKQSTNKTQTYLTPIKESIKKYIIDDGKAVDTDTITKQDPVSICRIDNIIPNDEFLKSVMLVDPLDKALEVADQSKIKVIASDAKANEVKVSENKEENATKAEDKKEETTDSSKDTSKEANKPATFANEAGKEEAGKKDTVNYDELIKQVQPIVDKYKNAKPDTKEHVVLSNAKLVSDVLVAKKAGQTAKDKEALESINKALAEKDEKLALTGDMKKDVETLKSVLEKAMASTPAKPDTSKPDASKPSDKPTDSSSDQGTGNAEESKGETEKEETDKPTADNATKEEIAEDVNKEMTGDATPKGEDVTKKGKLEVKDGKVTWTANNPSEFAGKKLSLIIPVKLKAGMKVSDLPQKDGEVQIPNTAKLVVNGKDVASNTVYVGVDKEIKEVPKEAPKPEDPKPEEPQQIEGDPKPKFLPQTGTDMMKTVGVGAIGVALGGVVGFLFGRKKK